MSYYTLKNGEKLYYRDTLEGDQTIIMLHGWTSTHEVFESSVSRISKYARCIIFDQRGHGKSREANKDIVIMDTLAGDVNELINGLGLKNVTLLGWSMGAGVVLNYTRIFGCSQLKQIVLCDMTPKQMNDDEWKLGLYQGRYTREDMINDQGKDFFSLYKDFAIAAVPSLARYPAFLIRRPLKKILSACDERVLKSLSSTMKVVDFREDIEKITVPVNYFYAVPGSLFSPDLAEWYREHIKTEYHAVPFENSTHMLISDHPEKFEEEVVRVLT